MRRSRFGDSRGFVFVELLIVIVILGFLVAAVLVAIDPAKRIQQSRNAKRWAETEAVLNAILTKQVDDRAPFLGNASAPIIASITNSQVIVSDHTFVDCASAATAPACPGQTLSFIGTDCIARLDDLVGDGVTGGYIAELPIDPKGAGNKPIDSPDNLNLGPKNSGYYIHKYENGRIEIGACYPDQNETIKAKR